MGYSLLTFGDMLTFVGLIIAVLQLLKPRYQLIWRATNSILKWLALSLLVIGYLSPLAAVIAPNIENVWHELSLSDYIQVAGFICITLGFIVIAIIFSRINTRNIVHVWTKYTFNSSHFPKKGWRRLNIEIGREKIASTKSMVKFYRLASQYLMMGHVEEVVFLVRSNLPQIVHAAYQYTPERFALKEEQDITKPNGANYAFELMYQLLTDKTVMMHICENDRFFLDYIVECTIKSTGPYMGSEFTRMLYPNIFLHLATNQTSLLYRQKDMYYGSARLGNVYDLLTDERIVRRCNIVPSQLTWHVTNENIPADIYVEALFAILERLIDGYKHKPDSREHLANIRSILNQLMGDDGIIRKLSYNEEFRMNYGKGGSVDTAEGNALIKLHTGMSQLLFGDNDPDSIKTDKAELNAKNEHSVYDEATLTSLLAHKVYDLIEDLSVLVRDSTEPDSSLVREVAEWLWGDKQSPNYLKYKQLLWERLFDKAVIGKLEIAPNIEGYYPNILRFIINYLTPFEHRSDITDNEATERLKKVMSNELKDALLANKKMKGKGGKLMRSELLPQNITATINIKQKTVRYYHTNSKGKKQQIKLVPAEH
jgi:hypothetical protein